MKRKWLVLMTGFLLLGCGGGKTGREQQGASGGGIASPKQVTHADFRLDTLDGKSLGPSDYTGRVVLVDFWATWCLPCKAQARLLEGAYPRYSRDRVQFLAVDVAEPVDVVRKYVAGHPFSYPVLVDPEGKTTDQFGLAALPSLMVIDPAGKVTYFRAGLIGQKDLEDLLREAGAEAGEGAGGEERGARSEERGAGGG